MSSPTHENPHRFVIRMLLIGGLLTVVGLLTLATYTMNGHPVSIESLSSITIDSTQEDVRALLGNPSRVSSASGSVVWRYTSFTWCIVTVEFGPDGKVEVDPGLRTTG